MDVKDAIKVAKDYIQNVLAEEQIANLGLEETEFDPASGCWVITLGLSRPWNTPKTRAQEVLENLGAISSLRRSFKVLTISREGDVLSMKNKSRLEAAE